MSEKTDYIKEVLKSVKSDNLWNRPLKFLKKETIKSCDRCEGTGFIHQNELVDYHRREYAEFTKTCQKCKSSGRIIEIEYKVNFDELTTITTVPYEENPITENKVKIEYLYTQDLLKDL